MSHKILQLTPQLHDYLLDVSLREHPQAAALRQRTLQLTEHSMLSSPEQVQFMSLLLRSINAKNVIEVGTFTGYTALNFALAVPADGKIVCCDISDEWTSIGREFWSAADVENKIDLRIAPALQTMQQLLDKGHADSFDFAYIDADKENYIAYYQLAMDLVRPGGLIAIDNVLWDGQVINKQDESSSTESIRAFNQLLKQDNRVELSLLPVGDGLFLARKS